MKLFAMFLLVTSLPACGATPSDAPGSRTLASESYYVPNESPSVDIWVSPSGNDNDALGNPRPHGTSTSSAPYQTIAFAYQDIAAEGANAFLNHGYRFHLAGGTYSGDLVIENPNGGYTSRPITFQADGPGGVDWYGQISAIKVVGLFLDGDPSLTGARNLHVHKTSADSVVHFQSGKHLLVRGVELDGGAFAGSVSGWTATDETLKVNQAQYVYIEESDIHGASADNGNAIDFVAVQYAHVLDSHLHHSVDWCFYTKGGSAFVDVERNEMDHCGLHDSGGSSSKGGFNAGEGAGLQYERGLVYDPEDECTSIAYALAHPADVGPMPYMRYEAYGIRAINNLIHDTSGAGLSVQGGFNVAFAHNTLWNVSTGGAGTSTLSFGFGEATCDGSGATCDRQRCDYNQDHGAWGPRSTDPRAGVPVYIPNRHVYVYNNVIYNSGFSADQQITAYGRYTGDQNDATTRPPANPRGDDDLQIVGNLIWNGTTSTPLYDTVGLAPSACDGSGGSGTYDCKPDYAGMNAFNWIDTTGEPTMDSSGRPLSGSAISTVSPSVAIPAFVWDDSLLPWIAPEWTDATTVPDRHDGTTRSSPVHPGAY